MMTTDECGLTELPAEQCGCPRHRGGMTPTEQADVLRAEWAARVFLARMQGHCEACDEPIRPGQQISPFHGRRGVYRHADCEED
jgi:hypothetical protein